MAYNTNTERLLNAIKTNTANTSVTLSGDINAIDQATKDAILATDTATTQTELDTNYLVQHADGSTERGTNLASIVAAINALTAGSETLQTIADAISAIQNTTETLQDVINAVNGQDADIARLSTLETNSNTSLGKNGFTYHVSTVTSTSNRAAVQFVLETVVSNIQIGGSTDTGVAGTIPAGTIIYGDITGVTLGTNPNTPGFILYNE